MNRSGEDGDADLADRAAGGEDHAFTLLMRRHKASLYGFAYRYVGDGEAAMDIVQETFVSAWKALGRYDRARPFAVWLRAIALNKCRDRGRRIAVRRMVLGAKDADSQEAQRQADPAPSVETTLITAERRVELATAIASLPSKLKEPLILTYFEEYSQRQAAEFLGVSIKTVELRIYRARRKLAEALSGG